MNSTPPIPLLLTQTAAMAAADAMLASVGLPTYTALALRAAPLPPDVLPEGVVSLDAARADRKQAEMLGGRL